MNPNLKVSAKLREQRKVESTLPKLSRSYSLKDRGLMKSLIEKIVGERTEKQTNIFTEHLIVIDFT